MTAPQTPTPRPTLTSLTQLPAGIEEQLQNAQEARAAKVKRTALGVLFLLVGLALLGFAGYLALAKSATTLIVGTGGAGFVTLVFGALLADGEAVWPVMRAMLAYGIQVLKARRGQ